MKKYKVILSFNNGKTIESILLDEKPTEEFAEQSRVLYKADSYEILSVDE